METSDLGFGAGSSLFGGGNNATPAGGFGSNSGSFGGAGKSAFPLLLSPIKSSRDSTDFSKDLAL